MLLICVLVLVIHALSVGFQIGLLIKLSIHHNTTLSIPRIILFIILIVSATSVIFFFNYITSNEAFLSLVALVIFYCISINFVMTFSTPPPVPAPNTMYFYL